MGRSRRREEARARARDADRLRGARVDRVLRQESRRGVAPAAPHEDAHAQADRVGAVHGADLPVLDLEVFALGLEETHVGVVGTALARRVERLLYEGAHAGREARRRAG
jgi:hypothetical protein